MKILIMTGKFGMGHFSAAHSLAKQVQKANPQAEVAILDLLEYVFPACSNGVYQAFGLMVTHCSGAYNSYYNRMEKKGPDLRPAFLPYFLKKMKQLLEAEKPDAVLSTLPICSQIVSWYKSRTGDKIPLITCITDISSHSEWINANTDCYLVPSRNVKSGLTKKAVDGRRICVYGIPVSPEFDGREKDSVNSGGVKQILIMGGGLGILPENPGFYEELNACGHMKVTVITGKNKEIYNKLHGRYENIRVIGYTDEVYRYMQEADVVISKPGGITLFETIHSGTPILVFEPFLQQEINNTGFIIRNGIGIILQKNPEVCVREIDQIMKDDNLLNSMKRNVKRLKQQYDQGIIDHILSCVGCKNEEACVI